MSLFLPCSSVSVSEKFNDLCQEGNTFSILSLSSKPMTHAQARLRLGWEFMAAEPWNVKSFSTRFCGTPVLERQQNTYYIV